MRTLGKGSYSKVKLARDTKNDNKLVAIKLHPKTSPRADLKNRTYIMNEVNVLMNVKHPNIINVIEYVEEGKVTRKDGSSYDVYSVVVLEFAQGGELFFFVANSGYFDQRVSRFYFKQILSGLNEVHQAGVTHRDLKPDNLLMDDAFNIKIADFGFAAPIVGRDGSGYLLTPLGTESYMAPEIHKQLPYKGEAVDLYAVGIILFIVATGIPPFMYADET